LQVPIFTVPHSSEDAVASGIHHDKGVADSLEDWLPIDSRELSQGALVFEAVEGEKWHCIPEIVE
jgi:hypothetical protein